MRAIVLSGGGSKGAYQIGVWAALKKLNINYDIVTGTSVGALNAAIMTQNTFYKGLLLWLNLNYKMIFNNEIKDSYSTEEGKKNILKMYAKGVLNGGMNVEGLYLTINKIIDPKKFFSSKIDMGMITFNIKTFKPKKMTKKELNENNLCDYLLASASCFPAFKMKEINNENYIDGGIYDNLPINLAASLGATEVIAVDLKEVGIKRKIENKNIKVTYISPRSNIGSFLVFEKEMARKAIRLGYNDTLKTFNKLDGNIYTFRHNQINKYLNNYKNVYVNYIKRLLNGKSQNNLLMGILKLTVIEKIITEKNLKNEYINILDSLGKILEIDDSKIYSIAKYNKLIIDKFNNIEENEEIDNLIKQNKLKTLLNNKATIRYIYNLLNEKDKKKLYSAILLFPRHFLEAVYLKIIIEKNNIK